MRIDQVVTGASPFDAVTSSALELRRLLRSAGPSDLYARYIDPRLQGDVLPLEQFDGAPARTGDDLLLFHLSIGDEAVADFLRARADRLVVLFHNVSPATHHEPFDPPFARLLALGRAEAAALAPRAAMAIAFSEFSAAELRAWGYRDVRTMPLPVDLAAAVDVAPDPAVAAELAALDGPLLLFVGQVLPHKRLDLLLQSYHLLVTHLLPEARLLVVGATRSPSYSAALRRYADELCLDRLAWRGTPDQAGLAAHYRAADAFVTASDHEGFLVPVVEAMAFDVPVVARATAAVPGTVGDAGLLVPAEAPPALLAEAMAEVLTDPPLRTELRRRGRARVGAFDVARARGLFLEHLLAVA